MKKLILKLILPLIASCLVFIVIDQDSFLYKSPVGQIESVKIVNQSKQLDDYQNLDKKIVQELDIKLLNNTKESFKIENTAFESQARSQLYKKGQKVILRKQLGDWWIVDLKRDAVIAALITLFIGFLLSFMRLRASLLVVLSLVFNIIFFATAVLMNVHLDFSFLLIYAVLCLLFAVVSLLFVIGWNKQMFYTLVTTLVTMLVTFAGVYLVLNLTHNGGVHFEYLDYVTENPSLFFFVGCMISVLGAILDATGDIVAGLFGLARQNELNQIQMTRVQFMKSGLDIGQDIVGTLTNVLFMIFMAEAFPMTLLLLRNSNQWDYIFTVALNLGLLQTVICAIGIVLSLPITSFITSFGLPTKEGGKS